MELELRSMKNSNDLFDYRKYILSRALAKLEEETISYNNKFICLLKAVINDPISIDTNMILVRDQLYSSLRSDIESSLKELIEVQINDFLSSFTGKTKESGNFAQVSLNTKTSGLFQEIRAYNKWEDNMGSSILSTKIFKKGNNKLAHSLSCLIKDGYLIWPSRLKKNFLQTISEKTLKINKWTIIDEFENIYNSSKFDLGISKNKVIKAIGKINLTDQRIDEICTDPQLSLVLDSYNFGHAKLRRASIIYSFPSNKLEYASDNAAQQWHYDIDSHRWLKVFIYLNDVSEYNGPHAAKLGTHLPGSKHQTLLNKGYSRISDIEINSLQKEEATIFKGLAGTTIIADTKCYHRGTPLQAGERKILTLLFTTSQYGLKLM